MGGCFMPKHSVKFAIIGAGSVCFCPVTLKDILYNDKITSIPVEITLMDIAPEALRVSGDFAKRLIAHTGREGVRLNTTTSLEEALGGADFVITAIEVDRYRYWSMDFHIPRRYGFRQIYGENGGPGGMFHMLRNLPPMLEIAHAMERICPEAWLLNYTNPEAKLIEAITKLTKIKCVGLCHGPEIGWDMVAELLDRDRDSIDIKVAGLNHFGWVTQIRDRSTGEDLYPLLRERERKADWLSQWDEVALSRMMLRTFGLFPYPGSNHIGEYIAWSDEFLAAAKAQYFFDPVTDDPWNGGDIPEFIYNCCRKPFERPYFNDNAAGSAGDPGYLDKFSVLEKGSGYTNEYGIHIAQAILFDETINLTGVNLMNNGAIPNLPCDMVVEAPAVADAHGVRLEKTEPLPAAVASMIARQGAIHQLLIDAYCEKSRNKLLQAMLIDPTVSTYQNAVALINEMCERQKEILPPMFW